MLGEAGEEVEEDEDEDEEGSVAEVSDGSDSDGDGSDFDFETLGAPRVRRRRLTSGERAAWRDDGQP